jgi:hypothetical protein
MHRKTISGKVTDANGAPLQSATVSLKQSNVATTTDADGKFKLNVPANAAIIISAEFQNSNDKQQMYKMICR